MGNLRDGHTGLKLRTKTGSRKVGAEVVVVARLPVQSVAHYLGGLGINSLKLSAGKKGAMLTLMLSMRDV